MIPLDQGGGGTPRLPISNGPQPRPDARREHRFILSRNSQLVRFRKGTTFSRAANAEDSTRLLAAGVRCRRANGFFQQPV
jgi:hypothetical protein